MARWLDAFVDAAFAFALTLPVGVSLALRAREFSALKVTTDPVDTGDPTS